MMSWKFLIAALAALSLAATSAADAASKRKRQKVRAHPPAVTTPAKPAIARTPGPIWAGPNECFTDEGYGRYLQCGAGMDM
jgi:hypothetical protein